MAGSNLFTGTLDLLVLYTLRWGPKHGYGIGRWISERTGGSVDPEEGALYPALHRLEKKGFVKGAWGRRKKGAVHVSTPSPKTEGKSSERKP